MARAFHAASTSGEVAPQLAGALDLILVSSADDVERIQGDLNARRRELKS